MSLTYVDTHTNTHTLSHCGIPACCLINPDTQRYQLSQSVYLAQVRTMIVVPRCLSTAVSTCSVIYLPSDGHAGCYSVELEAAAGSQSSQSSQSRGFLVKSGTTLFQFLAARLELRWLGWVSLVQVRREWKKEGCIGLAWIMKTDVRAEPARVRAGAAGNVRGGIALCSAPLPALSARAFHSPPPLPASVTEW